MEAVSVPAADALLQDLPATAAYLGVDIADTSQLADLTAVAIAQLAWRNGPVELWHRASPSRISDPEMMRANAATTRVVREFLPDDVGLDARGGDMFATVCDALTDPERRLPDGRIVLDVAATAEDFEVYAEQVRAFFDRCRRLVDQCGASLVVGVLACYAAAAVWKWWLAPGWPSMVTKIIDFLDGRPAGQIESLARRVIRLPSGLDLTRLPHRLTAGPDQLSAQEARYCLVASVGAHLPQVHGLSPRSRRLLPATHRQLVSYLERPTENFRGRLKDANPPYPSG